MRTSREQRQHHRIEFPISDRHEFLDTSELKSQIIQLNILPFPLRNEVVKCACARYGGRVGGPTDNSRLAIPYSTGYVPAN
jgi:hypothetical protein